MNSSFPWYTQTYLTHIPSWRGNSNNKARSRSSALPFPISTIKQRDVLQNMLDIIIIKLRRDAIERRKLDRPPPLLSNRCIKRNNTYLESLLLLTTSLLLLLVFCKPNLLPPYSYMITFATDIPLKASWTASFLCEHSLPPPLSLS